MPVINKTIKGSQIIHNNSTHANDANTRHVTDSEKNTWNGKAAGNHSHGSEYLSLANGGTVSKIARFNGNISVGPNSNNLIEGQNNSDGGSITISVKDQYGNSSSGLGIVHSFVLPGSGDNKLNFGSENYRWKDAYVSGCIRADNGWTKLTNGLVLQWGSGTYDNGIFQVKLPIQFPNNSCFCCTVSNSFNGNGRQFVSINKTWDSQTLQITKYTADDALSKDVLHWIAIGY